MRMDALRRPEAIRPSIAVSPTALTPSDCNFSTSRLLIRPAYAIKNGIHRLGIREAAHLPRRARHLPHRDPQSLAEIIQFLVPAMHEDDPLARPHDRREVRDERLRIDAPAPAQLNHQHTNLH